MFNCCAETPWPRRNSCEGKHLTETGFHFRGLVYYCCGLKHGGVQADKEKEPRAGREWGTLPSTRQTYSNKATPPSSATPYGSMSAIFLQTTTVPTNTCQGLEPQTHGKAAAFSIPPPMIQRNDNAFFWLTCQCWQYRQKMSTIAFLSEHFTSWRLISYRD